MSEALTTAFNTALTTIQSDFTGMITVAMPIALGMFGVLFALRAAKNFFSSLAN